MDDVALGAAGVAPTEWFIVFQRVSPLPWVNRLVPGRYKHVRCFAPLPAVNGWLFYEMTINRMDVAVVPNGRADPFIARATGDGLVVRWVAPIVIPGWRLKPAFLCVSAVAHITGVPSCALRPDTFLRDCLRAGAETVITNDHELQHQHQARPAPDAGSGDVQE